MQICQMETTRATAETSPKLNAMIVVCFAKENPFNISLMTFDIRNLLMFVAIFVSLRMFVHLIYFKYLIA